MKNNAVYLTPFELWKNDYFSFWSGFPKLHYFLDVRASFLAMVCSEITAQNVRGCRRLLLSLNYNVVGTYTYLTSDGLDHLIRNTRIEEIGWGAAFSKKVAEILFAECDPTQIISYNTQNSNFIRRELIGVYTHCSR